jgi:hypothetical protein
MKLSEMTTEQLRAKRARIDQLLIKKSPVKIVQFKFDPGDDRTTGYFELEADTPLGLLTGSGVVNGDFGEEEWELNGQELEEHPGLGLPQASEACGGYFEDRQTILLIEVLEQWCEEAQALKAKGRQLTK